jgi:hypothetical protein
MPSKKGESDVFMKGIHGIRWTGYKESQDNVCLIGQWVAITKTGKVAWATTNGVTSIGVMERAVERFYIPDPEWKPINLFSSGAEKEERKQQTLALLIKFIESLDPKEWHEESPETV